MATKKQKEQLVRAIKNPERYFKVEFGRYGGEVAMGTITKAQFDHWEGRNDELATHIASADWGDDREDDGTPEDAKFTKQFYEYEDICHLSGPEFADGQTMTLTEVDKDGEYLRDSAGNFLEEQVIDMKDFKKKGVKVKCLAEHHSGSKSCKDRYYVFGQYFNKGGFYPEDHIKTGSAGFDFKKLSINYENADGFRVFNSFIYDGEEHYLQEDSTGKSSSFYVEAGDDV